MHKLVGENSQLCKKVAEYLKKIIKEKKASLKPQLVILYGSIARGDWHEGSDIDLLVISDFVPANFRDRGSVLLDVVQGIPIEPHVYTTREFDEMLTYARMTALDALSEGIILYAKKNYLKKVKEKFKQTVDKFKAEKTDNGWKLKIK